MWLNWVEEREGRRRISMKKRNINSRDYVELFQIFFFAYSLSLILMHAIFSYSSMTTDLNILRNRLMTFSPRLHFFFLLFIFLTHCLQAYTFEPDDSWLRIWFVIVTDHIEEQKKQQRSFSGLQRWKEEKYIQIRWWRARVKKKSSNLRVFFRFIQHKCNLIIWWEMVIRSCECRNLFPPESVILTKPFSPRSHSVQRQFTLVGADDIVSREYKIASTCCRVSCSNRYYFCLDWKYFEILWSHVWLRSASARSSGHVKYICAKEVCENI